jgi:hypothetical protein
MRSRTARLAAAIGFVALSCTDSTTPQTTNVGGNWVFTVNSITGTEGDRQVNCANLTSGVMALTQTGTTFSGRYWGGELSCTYSSGSLYVTLDSGTFVNGRISGANIAFDFDAPQFHLTGTMSGSTASGVASLEIPSDTVSLAGSWSASQGPSANTLYVTITDVFATTPLSALGVSVDGGPSQAVQADGTLTITNLTAGDHTIALTDVPNGCMLRTPGLATLTVVTGGVAPVAAFQSVSEGVAEASHVRRFRSS